MAKNIFESAVRNKTRFQFNGNINAEDLWDLSVTDLDTIFKGLNALANNAKQESLLDKPTKKPGLRAGLFHSLIKKALVNQRFL